jgi:hypothetical protein
MAINPANMKTVEEVTRTHHSLTRVQRPKELQGLLMTVLNVTNRVIGPTSAQTARLILENNILGAVEVDSSMEEQDILVEVLTIGTTTVVQNKMTLKSALIVSRLVIGLVTVPSLEKIKNRLIMEADTNAKKLIFEII